MFELPVEQVQETKKIVSEKKEHAWVAIDSTQFDMNDDIMSQGECASVKAFADMPIQYTVLPKLPEFEFTKYTQSHRNDVLWNKIRKEN